MTNINKEKRNIQELLFLVALLLTTICMVPDLLLTPAANTLYIEFNDENKVNLLLTITSMLSIFSSIITGFLMKIFDKKHILIFGVFCYTFGTSAGGILDNLMYMIFMRGIVGIGMGMTLVSCLAIISNKYPDVKERSRHIGYINAAMSICGIIIVLVAGFLAENFGWKSMFHTGWIGIIIILFIIFFVDSYPPIKSENDESSTNSNLRVNLYNEKRWKLNLTALLVSYFIFDIFYGIVMFQLAVYIGEQGIGNEAISGITDSIRGVFTFVASIAFGFLYKKQGRFLAVLNFAFLAIGFIILMVTNNLVCTIIGVSFIGYAYGNAMSYFPVQASYIVPKKNNDFAMSLISFVMSVGLCLSVYVSTFIKKLFDCEYFIDQLPIVIFLTCLGTIISIILSFRNKFHSSNYYFTESEE